MQQMLADSVVVLDFETSGLSPKYGDRAIEIGAVLVEQGVIVDRFQKLMNPGFRIKPFIEHYTGLTNEMLEGQPCCEEDSPNHKLQTLVSYSGILQTAAFHRALADAEMTAYLWMSMIDRIRQQYGIPMISFDQLSELSRVDKLSVHRYLTSLAKGCYVR